MNKLNQDEELTELIREQIDHHLAIYDDASRQISRHFDSEKNYYIELAKESMTMVKDLITQLPNKDREIRVYMEKVQWWAVI